MTAKIRRARPADIDGIVSVGHQVWPATYEFAGPEYIAHGLTTWWSAAAIERSLDDTTVLVADADDAVVGVGNIDLRGEVPIIWKLYVIPSAQRTGVGSALIRDLVSVAGDRPVRLEYSVGNDRAARFYARHGFTELRREPNDEPGWPDRVWMERAPS